MTDSSTRAPEPFASSSGATHAGGHHGGRQLAVHHRTVYRRGRRHAAARVLMAGMAVAVASSGVAGCGSAPPATSPTEVRVAALSAVDDAPLFIAKRRGLFRKAGLRVKISMVAQSTQAVPKLVNGTIDVVAGANYVNYFQAAARKVLRLRIVADGYQTLPHVTAVLPAPGMKDKITTPGDLKGKKVAFSVLKSVTTMTFDKMLSTVSGVKPEEVDHVEVAFPRMLATLKTDSVDAAYTIEPFTTAIEKQLGVKPILDPTGPGTDQTSGPTAAWPMSGYLAPKRWVDDHPKVAAAFQKVIQQAQAIADKDPAAVRRVLPAYTAIDENTAAIITLGYWPTSLSAKRLQRVAELANESGLLPANFEVAPLIFTPGGHK